MSRPRSRSTRSTPPRDAKVDMGMELKSSMCPPQTMVQCTHPATSQSVGVAWDNGPSGSVRAPSTLCSIFRNVLAPCSGPPASSCGAPCARAHLVVLTTLLTRHPVLCGAHCSLVHGAPSPLLRGSHCCLLFIALVASSAHPAPACRTACAPPCYTCCTPSEHHAASTCKQLATAVQMSA